MEAKDTVVHDKGCMSDGYITGGCLGDKKIHYDCTCGREAQAEISFKAGYDEGYDDGYGFGKSFGIREVVEIVDDMLDGMGLGEDNFKISDWEAYQEIKNGG